MIVHQVPIGSDSLLRALYAALRTMDVSGMRPDVIRWQGLPLATLPPVHDIDIDTGRCLAHLERQQRSIAGFVPADVRVRAVYYYPEGGGLDWHTNSALPGWRVYVPLVTNVPRSGTRTESGWFPDKPGCANMFQITNWRDSWHCVEAHTARLSVGIWVAEQRARKLLATKGQ